MTSQECLETIFWYLESVLDDESRQKTVPIVNQLKVALKFQYRDANRLYLVPNLKRMISQARGQQPGVPVGVPNTAPEGSAPNSLLEKSRKSDMKTIGSKYMGKNAP